MNIMNLMPMTLKLKIKKEFQKLGFTIKKIDFEKEGRIDIKGIYREKNEKYKEIDIPFFYIYYKDENSSIMASEDFLEELSFEIFVMTINAKINRIKILQQEEEDSKLKLNRKNNFKKLSRKEGLILTDKSLLELVGIGSEDIYLTFDIADMIEYFLLNLKSIRK